MKHLFGLTAMAAALCGFAASAAPLIGANEWQAYAQAFVEPSGRVIDDANGRISHSESQGYGLLLATLADQPAAFDAIWSFTRTEMQVRNDGLFAWRWDPAATPHVTDTNNATDGDILIAYALAVAADTWSRDDYRDTASELAQSLGKHAIIRSIGMPVLLPGLAGFQAQEQPDGPIVNLSYWVFEAFERFRALDPSTDWAALTTAGLRLLREAQFGPRHLPPDWLALGSGLAPAKGFDAVYGYNAIRIPLYLIRAGIGDDALLRRLAGASDDGVPAVIDLGSGKADSSLGEPGYRAIAALLACRLDGAPLPDDLRAFSPTLYYPSTLHLLVLAQVRKAMPQCL